jgi:predicted GNAT family N-acyltransferase
MLTVFALLSKRSTEESRLNFKAILTSWQENRDNIGRIRRQVFIDEQHVPVELEWEGDENIYQYVLVFEDTGQVIGTGRISKDGHIGRMAVTKCWRGKGVGQLILEKLIQYAIEQNINKLSLNAQITAVGFYQKQGFTGYGAEFLDAGIVHKRMHRVFANIN